MDWQLQTLFFVMPKKLFRWCNSVTRDLNINVLKPKLAVTKADVENKATSSTSCGTGPCLNGSRTLYCPSRCYRILVLRLPILWCPKRAYLTMRSGSLKSTDEPSLASEQKSLHFLYTTNFESTLQTPPTDCRCKPSQQLAMNVAYSVVWPILVSRSLLPTQLCPCCSTKMNWPSTLLLASFQQMLIHSAQGSGKLSRYFQTRCWCTSLHLNSECRPVQGAFKTNLPQQIWVGWWWYLNDLDEIIISDVDLAS